MQCSTQWGLFVKQYLLAVGTFLVLANSLLIALGRRRLSLDLSFVSAAICLNLYLALFFLLGNNRCQNYLERKVKERAGVPFLFLLVLFGSYLVYAVGTRSFQWFLFLKLAIYILFPALVYLTFKNPPDRWQCQDVVVFLTFWLPLH